jgi:hypothetical protein
MKLKTSWGGLLYVVAESESDNKALATFYVSSVSVKEQKASPHHVTECAEKPRYSGERKHTLIYAAIAGIKVGETRTIVASTKKAISAVSNTAYYKLGKGNYHTKSNNGAVFLTRLK